MRHVTLLIAAFGLFLIAQPDANAAPIERLTRASGAGCAFAGPPKCAIKVNFGSVCCGPDREALRKVTAYVEASSTIERGISCPYGKEGDQVLCLVVPDRSKASAAYHVLMDMLPAPGTGPSSRGVTTVTLE